MHTAASARQPTRDYGSVPEAYDDTLRFYLNGTRVELDLPDPEVTLLEYLRGIGLTGTKLGCAEGGCGACTVVVSHLNPTTGGKLYHASVNACLAPLVSVDGKHVITIEGIGTSKSPHPAQQRIALSGGSQCGFCTPGIVMSLYALLRNEHGLDPDDPGPSPHAIEEAFDGNLCRCTGYRPILDAAHSFGKEKGCGKHQLRPLAFGNKRKKWYRPVTLQQLLEIKHVCPKAKLIGGSTETQIEVKFKAMQYTTSVYVGDIAELKQYRFHDDYVEIGGNVALTDLENICDEAVQHYGEAMAQPFKAIRKAIRYFAGRQIRNVGTPAGNLATASPISDLNPVFVATNSVMVARSLQKTTEINMDVFFKGYRTTALPEDAVIVAMRVPVAAEKGEYVRTYKQSKRKDDDIAIVNACLRVRLDGSNTVQDCSLVYGGMAPTTISARNAMKYLEGKIFDRPETLEGVMGALETDFNLPFSVPGGMATYRKSLALGFFYRFFHDILSVIDSSNEELLEKEAIEEIEREISFGKKDHDASVAYSQKVLGKANPHVAALKQCTGEAQYTDDIPVQQNELRGCLVLSTKAHAKLLKVDPAPALDLPGVVAWVDRHDVASPKANWWGAPVCDEVFFAEDEVFTAGQPIGMILANTAHQAAAGARAVKIEYEDLPAIFTIEEAVEKQSFFEHYHYIKTGDVDKAFKECDHVFTGTARMGGQEHFYLETQACLAIWKPEDGEMEVWASTQNPTETQSYVAQATGVQSNKIVAKVKRLGGGFGGKETRSVQLSTICAVAAKKVKRPVRCMLNRDEDILTSGQRHPFMGVWKVGVNKDGKIQALEAKVYNNGGWSQDLSAAVVDRALSHIDGCYNIPNVFVQGRVCRTNTVSNSAFRGFGGPQGMFIAEQYMSEVADHLGLPVERLREINMYKPLELTHFNQSIEDWHVPLMWEQVKAEADYEARRQAVREFNATHKWQKKGLALIPTKFGISFTALFLNQAGALVHIYHDDGSVLVAHGGTEMGQGLHTKICMIVAEALQVPLSDVHISETATNTVANTSSTAASASSDLNGYAAYNACVQLNQRLAPYRAKLGPAATMKQLAHAAYFDRVNLSAHGFYKTPEIGYTWAPNPPDPTLENTGKMFFYFTQGVAAAEVLIDTLTGDWTVLRADLKMDVGRSINPAIDYGQIEGAFVQGQGLFTTEESLWLRGGGSSGTIFTRGPGAYKIPGFRDIPQVFNVSLLKGVEWTNLRTIQRSRGVGEPPLFLGSAVFFAIRDALNASRAQWGEKTNGTNGTNGSGGVLSLRSPCTPERIVLESGTDISTRCRVQPRDSSEKEFFISI
ncbi:hypothetical protein DV738_g4616, partial [Chaetothyriales sp. CBS 135597]